MSERNFNSFSLLLFHHAVEWSGLLEFNFLNIIVGFINEEEKENEKNNQRLEWKSRVRYFNRFLDFSPSYITSYFLYIFLILNRYSSMNSFNAHFAASLFLSLSIFGRHNSTKNLLHHNQQSNCASSSLFVVHIHTSSPACFLFLHHHHFFLSLTSFVGILLSIRRRRKYNDV